MATEVDPSLIKGLTIGLGAIGPAIGVGLSGAAVVGAVGRNPEMQGKILSTAFIPDISAVITAFEPCLYGYIFISIIARQSGNCR